LESESKKGRPVPALDSRPDLNFFEKNIWHFWCRLNAHRQPGFYGIQPLPVQEIIYSLQIEGYEGELLRDSFRLVSSLDLERIRIYNSEQEKKRKAKKKKKKKRGK